MDAFCHGYIIKHCPKYCNLLLLEHPSFFFHFLKSTLKMPGPENCKNVYCKSLTTDRMPIMWHYKNPILTISARWYHAMHALKEKGGRRGKKGEKVQCW